MVSVMRSPAPCWSGELASEASTPVRNVMTLPGITRSATAVSRAWSIAEPVARSRLGAGAPARPGQPEQRHDHERPARGLGGGFAHDAHDPHHERFHRGQRVELDRPGAEDGGGRRRRQHRDDGAEAAAPGSGAAAPIRRAGKDGNGVPATTAA